MAHLNLYRRHASDCALHATTYEADELRRSSKSCHCPIYASGTLAGQFKRRNTECTTWEEAKTVVRPWEDAGSWDGPATLEGPAVPVRAPGPAPAPEGNRVTVAQALKTFTAEFQEYAAANTQKKYGLLLKKLKTFSDAHGFVMLDQFAPIHVREFRSSWGVRAQTAAKNMSTVKASMPGTSEGRCSLNAVDFRHQVHRLDGIYPLSRWHADYRDGSICRENRRRVRDIDRLQAVTSARASQNAEK